MPCDNTTKTSSEIEHVDWSTGTGSGHHYATVRFGSGSSQASQSSGDICRICHCESDPQNPLLTPCYCAGSLKYVHQSCLQQWLTASETNSCELCKFPFIMHTKIKPFNEWRSLDISGIERRRLCCSVLFHCAAALCVIWSLCVLIERAADDVKRGLIDWPFWTKLAVVTVGLTGGVVFMYIQCKAYLHLCHRWKARNRILLIQNAPEKVHPLSPPSPIATHRSSRLNETARNSNAMCGNFGVAAGGVGVPVEIAANADAASRAYNYANAAGINMCAGGIGIEMDGIANPALRRHGPIMYQHNYNNMLPMQQQAELDMLPRNSSIEAYQHQQPLHLTSLQQQQQQQQLQQQLGQVAVAANIECSQSQHNYERDWALDDVVSQISSFRPCPQGSGSMTPFHDSIHNVLEGQSQGSSRGSRQDLSTDGMDASSRREHGMQLSSFSGSGEHKAASVGSGVSSAVANGLGGFVYKPYTNKRCSNSSIFLENRDILNDSVSLGLDCGVPCDYAQKINYRHSSILTPSDAGADVAAGGSDDQLDKFLGKDLRRYSDTKLLGCTTDAADAAHDSMLFSGVHVVPNKSAAAAADNMLDMQLPTSPLSPPNIFIVQQQQQQQQPKTTFRRSLNTMDACATPLLKDGAQRETQQIDKARLFFKSLPNLSSSCESLIKK